MATSPSVDYHALAKKNNSVYSVHESEAAYLPPEIERIRHAVNAQLVQGKPLPDGGISSVGEHETSKIEVNDPKKFALGPTQTESHEIVHLWQNSIAPPLQAKIPPDDPNHPYALDLDKLDALRKQGVKLSQLPREMAASLVQRWVASPQDRPRLQSWLSDLNTTPLSVMMPTAQDAKGLNRQVRPPVPPVEAWMNTAELKAQAHNVQAKYKPTGVVK